MSLLSTRLGMAKKLAAKAVTKGSKTARGAHDASVEVVTGPRAAKMEAVVNLHDTVEDNQKDDEDDDFDPDAQADEEDEDADDEAPRRAPAADKPQRRSPRTKKKSTKSSEHEGDSIGEQKPADTKKRATDPAAPAKTKRQAVDGTGTAQDRPAKAKGKGRTVPYTKPRRKARTNPLTAAELSAWELAKERNVQTILPSFADRTFPTFEAFEKEWDEYCMYNFALYRCRTSKTRKAYNREQRGNVSTDEESPDDEDGGVFLPKHITYWFRWYPCTHGPAQKSRSTGARAAKYTRFTNCQARIKAQARYDPETKSWSVVIENELTTHNHTCDAIVYSAYGGSSEITDAMLFREVQSMAVTESNVKKVCDLISRRLGRRFSRRQYENFRNYRMGGGDAVESARILLSKFTSFKGARCLIVEDQDEQAVVITMQSGFQRELVKRWGDTLILDWTHNTNNRGYYLGALMVTTANGTGVPVYTFLSLTQGMEMLRAVLRRFLETNKGATERIKSVVIDKDLTEWRVLEELLPDATVVLCQFHALKWFKGVVHFEKYSLSKSQRAEVLKILRSLVYAPTLDVYEAHKRNLAWYLRAEKHAPFLDYMEKCWYSCMPMWCNAGRGHVFTATNTTSNRLEANWHQLKLMIGNKQRIDFCIESIFAHGTSVLEREDECLVNYLAKSPLYTSTHPFVVRVFAEISEYAYEKTKLQWAAYTADTENYSSSRVGVSTSVYVVRVKTTLRQVEFQVDVRLWSCSCHFYCGNGLPCRHLYFVARDVLQLARFPIEAIPDRWRLDRAAETIHDLKAAIKESQTLRLTPVPVASDKAEVASLDPLRQVTKKVAFVKLRRGEPSKSAVMGEIEKFNTFKCSSDPLREFLMRQSTLHFSEFAVDYDESNKALMKKWEAKLKLYREQDDLVDDVGSVAPRTDEIPLVREVYGADGAEEGFDCPQNEENYPVPAAVEDFDNLDLNEFYGSQASSLHFESPSVSSYGAIRFPSPLADQEPRLWRTGELTELLRDCGVSGAVDGVLRDAYVHGVGEAGPPRLQRKSGGMQMTLEELVHQVDVMSDNEDSPATASVDDNEDSPVTASMSDAMASLGNEAVVVHVDGSGAGVAREQPAVRNPPSRRGKEAVTGEDTPARSTRAAMRLKNAKPTIEATTPEEATVPDEDSESGELKRLKMASVLRKGQTRTAKQLGSATARLLPINQDCSCPVVIKDFVAALCALRCLQDVVRLQAQYPLLYDDKGLQKRDATVRQYSSLEGDFDFNFVVPKALQLRLTSAIALEKKAISEKPKGKQNGPVYYVAKIANEIRGFSEATVQHLVEFYDMKTRAEAYVIDSQWVAIASSWDVPRSCTRVPFLQRDADEVEGLIYTRGSATMRSQILETLGTVAMKTVLTVPSQTVDLCEDIDSAEQPYRQRMAIELQELLGRVADSAQLNDSAVNFSLHLLASRHDDVYVVNSLMVGKSGSVLPVPLLRKQRIVAFPIHYDKHWCIILVSVSASEKLKCQVYLYDPLVSASFQELLKATWESWCRPLLQAWSARDEWCEIEAFDLVYVDVPKQRDSDSCGLFCVVQAHCYFTGDFGSQDAGTFTAFQVRLMRLRLLWLLLARSKHTHPVDVDGRHSRVIKQFSTYFQEVVKPHSKPHMAPKKTAKRKSEGGEGAELDERKAVKQRKTKKGTTKKTTKKTEDDEQASQTEAA